MYFLRDIIPQLKNFRSCIFRQKTGGWYAVDRGSCKFISNYVFPDVLLGIVPSTKFSDGLKGRSCTLHQRSSSESVSGSDHSHEIASVEVPSTSSHLRRERLESGKWEGLSGQQLAWLEQQEIKPGHFTEAYVRNLGSSSRPLFSLKKMEVRGRESRSRVPSNVKERERKGNSERRKSELWT